MHLDVIMTSGLLFSDFLKNFTAQWRSYHVSMHCLWFFLMSCKQQSLYQLQFGNYKLKGNTKGLKNAKKILRDQ